MDLFPDAELENIGSNSCTLQDLKRRNVMTGMKAHWKLCKLIDWTEKWPEHAPGPYTVENIFCSHVNSWIQIQIQISNSSGNTGEQCTW